MSQAPSTVWCVFFERRCPGCGNQAARVCPLCWSNFLRSAPPPSELAAIGQGIGLDGLGALGSYEASSRPILLAAKNGGRRDLLASFGATLAELGGAEAAVVTWVPASRKMKRRRGYDQGRILARAVAHRAGLSTRSLLRRTSRQTQAGATRSERLLGPDLIGVGHSPSSVILIDDVCTSGASLAAATRVLRAHGAVEVRANVVAVVPGTKVPE